MYATISVTVMLMGLVAQHINGRCAVCGAGCINLASLVLFVTGHPAPIKHGMTSGT